MAGNLGPDHGIETEVLRRSRAVEDVVIVKTDGWQNSTGKLLRSLCIFFINYFSVCPPQSY